MGQGLGKATGMVVLMDMALGEMRGIQDGLLGGGIHMRLTHRLPCLCKRFQLSRLCWQRNPSPQFGIFVHRRCSTFRT